MVIHKDEVYFNCTYVHKTRRLGMWALVCCIAKQETPQCNENQVFNDSTKYLWPKPTKTIEQKLNFYI